MNDIIEMIYDIITAYHLSGNTVYNESIRTIFRGPKKDAPIALDFKDLYCYGLRKEIDMAVIDMCVTELIRKQKIMTIKNQKTSRVHYKPTNIQDAIMRLDYINKNRAKLIEENY
jgi:hypothetical protein